MQIDYPEKLDPLFHTDKRYVNKVKRARPSNATKVAVITFVSLTFLNIRKENTGIAIGNRLGKPFVKKPSHNITPQMNA